VVAVDTPAVVEDMAVDVEVVAEDMVVADAAAVAADTTTDIKLSSSHLLLSCKLNYESVFFVQLQDTTWNLSSLNFWILPLNQSLPFSSIIVMKPVSRFVDSLSLIKIKFL